jgi:hypothetical protein
MADETVVQAESSPAPVVQDSSELLASMSREERSEWRATGKTPEPKAQESATADPSKETKSVTEPEAEAGKKPQEQKGAPGAEARIRELIAQKKELERKLQERETKPEPAKVETKPVEAKKDDKPAEYVPLDQEKFFADNPDKTYEDYVEARVEHKLEWKAEQKSAADAKADAERKQAEQKKTVEESWKSRVNEAAKKHDDFKEVAGSKEFNDLIPAGSVLDGWMIDSELGAEILYHYGKNREELTALLAMSPFKQARALSKLEDKLAEAKPADAPEKDVVAPAKKVSDAPKPASEVGGRATAPEDEAGAAAKDNDYRRFKAEQDRRDTERMKAR